MLLYQSLVSPSVAGSALIARTYMKWVLTEAHNLQRATSMYSCHGVDLPEDIGAKTSLRSRLRRETIIWSTSAQGNNIAYTPEEQSNSSCSVNTLQSITRSVFSEKQTHEAQARGTQ